MTRNEAVYNAFLEIVPPTKNEVEVQVEEDVDEYGTFVRVWYQALNPNRDVVSSKYYYETTKV